WDRSSPKNHILRPKTPPRVRPAADPLTVSPCLHSHLYGHGHLHLYPAHRPGVAAPEPSARPAIPLNRVSGLPLLGPALLATGPCRAVDSVHLSLCRPTLRW